MNGYIYISANTYRKRSGDGYGAPHFAGMLQIKLTSEQRIAIIKRRETDEVNGIVGNTYYLIGDTATVSYATKYISLSISGDFNDANPSEFLGGGQTNRIIDFNFNTNQSYTWSGTLPNPSMTTPQNLSLSFNTQAPGVRYMGTYSDYSTTIAQPMIPVMRNMFSGSNNAYTAPATFAGAKTKRLFFGFCGDNSLTNSNNEHIYTLPFYKYNNGLEPLLKSGTAPNEITIEFGSASLVDTPYVTKQQDPYSDPPTQVTYGDIIKRGIPAPFKQANPGFDGLPLILNIPIFEDTGDGKGIDKAERYVATGEGEPDVYTDSDDDGNPEGYSSKGGDGDDYDDTPRTTHTEEQDNINIKGQNFYYMGRTELDGFITWFWQDMFDLMLSDLTDVGYNAITGAYGNLANYIISCRAYHIPSRFFSAGMTDPQNIILGRYTSNITADRIRSGVLEDQIVGSYFFEPRYNNFFGFAPYVALSLYLPFLGVRPLDPNIVINRVITVYASCDLYTGNITYNVYTSKSSKSTTKTLLFSETGKCAVDIPLALADAMGDASRAMNGIVGGLLGGAVGALTGGVGGAVQGVANGVTGLTSGNLISAPLPQQSGAGGNQAYLQPSKCAIMVQNTNYKEHGERQKYADAGLGYICHEVHKLQDGTPGEFYQVGEIVNLDMMRMTDEEVEEVKQLLQEGVYL